TAALRRHPRRGARRVARLHLVRLGRLPPDVPLPCLRSVLWRRVLPAGLLERSRRELVERPRGSGADAGGGALARAGLDRPVQRRHAAGRPAGDGRPERVLRPHAALLLSLGIPLVRLASQAPAAPAAALDELSARRRHPRSCAGLRRGGRVPLAASEQNRGRADAGGTVAANPTRKPCRGPGETAAAGRAD